MKKLIERNLPFSNRYELKGITRCEDGFMCSNCNKPIVNIATVVCDAEIYYIGLDCLKTLKEAKSLQENETDLVYSFNLCTKVVTEINKGKKFDYDDLFVRVLNDKQKVITCYTNDLKKYYPELF